MYTHEDLVKVYRISKPNIKELSINTYIKNLKLFKKLYDGNPDIIDFKFLIPTEKYDPKSLLTDKPITTQRNFYNSILPIILSYKTYPNKYNYSTPLDNVEKYYGNLIKLTNNIQKNNSDKNIISEAKKEKYSITFNDLMLLIPKLKEDNLLQDAIILSLMLNYKFRNEIATLLLLKEDLYNKLTDEEKQNNFIVLKADCNMFISRGTYKTDSKYGVTITKILNEQLKIDLHNYIINLPNDILFTDKTGKQYTTKYISTRIGRITKKYLGVAVGTSSINNLFLETLDKDTLRTLRTLSHDRGTSINVLVGHYFNDIDDNN